MSKDQALRLALEALEFDGFTPEDATHRSYHAKAITAIKQVLEQPEPDGDCKHCVNGCPACDARRITNVLL